MSSAPHWKCYFSNLYTAKMTKDDRNSWSMFWRYRITCAAHRIRFGDHMKAVVIGPKVKAWCRSQNPLLRSRWRRIRYGRSELWIRLQNAAIDDYHRWSLLNAVRTWEELCTALGTWGLKHDVFILPFNSCASNLFHHAPKNGSFHLGCDEPHVHWSRWFTLPCDHWTFEASGEDTRYDRRQQTWIATIRMSVEFTYYQIRHID